MSNFMDNFKSISYRANFNMTDDRFTESGYLIAADVEGWVTTDPESQMFARINMTKPVERSIEVLTHSSFDVYLNDLDAGKWYFIPENSDAGPLEDISQLYFWGLAFSVLPTSSFEQSPDGYVVTQGDPSFGTVTASYDQAYTLRSVVFSDTEGKEALRVSFFDLNKPHDIRPYQKGEGLPEDYWEPTKAVPMPAPSQETAKATPLPATGSQTGVTPEIRPAGDPNSPFVQVSVGLFHSCGLRVDGSIVCWGASGEDDRLTEATGLIDSPPGTFSQISAGDLHSCALRRDGTVECWGGMLVEDLFQDDTPPDAKAMMEAMLAPPEGQFISVSAGFHFSCGVRIDNSAECWGLAVVAGAPTPPDGKYTSVSAGGFHACGIRIDQTVVCWGSNSGFDGDFLGQATPPDGPFEVISAGGYHTCGFRPDGEIRCWGSIVGGPDGEIQICEPQADGTSRCWTDERVNEAYRAWGGGPDSVPDGSRKVIDSDQRFSCALWYESSIGCWGSGSPDGWPPPGPFEAFSVSRNHGCGLRPDGSIECWGEDTFGQASPP